MISIWNMDLGTRRRPEDAILGSGVTAVFDHGYGVSWIGVDAVVQGAVVQRAVIQEVVVGSGNGTRVSAARERSP
jgi:hypothetical protein